MEKLNKRMVFCAFVVCMLAFTTYALAAHTHSFGLRRIPHSLGSDGHYYSYTTNCPCGASDPNSPPVPGPTPPEPHTPQTNYKNGKDITSCSVCGYKISETNHTHKWKLKRDYGYNALNGKRLKVYSCVCGAEDSRWYD